MKKVISLLMSLVMLLSITAGLNLTASAETDGDFSYYLNSDNTVTITEYTGSETNLDIPSTIAGKSVTSIGDSAFYNCTSLASIKIPSSVTSIGDRAFSSCESLTSVTIPNSVTSIGDDAFQSCTSLTSINVGESNTNYSSQDGVLFNKDKTELIRYPIGNTRTSYIIPNSVTSIDSWAFDGCTSLTSINVEESNANYSSQDGVLFNKDKTELIRYPIGNTRTSYIIPNSVTSIGDSAFFGCTSLTSVTIPDSVTSIVDLAFSFCSSLTSVTIPNSVTSIGQIAFGDCESLTSITIPDSVTSIGNYTFNFCTSLTSVTIPNSVTSIGWCAFYDCTSLKDVYYSGIESEWNSITVGDGNDCLLNATIHYSSEPSVDPTPTPEPSTTTTQPVPQPTTVTTQSQPTNAPTTVAPAPAEPTTVANTVEPTIQTTTKAVAKPKAAKFKKVKGSKKAIALTWAKVKGVKGYQIQVATDKKFKKNKKTVTIKKQKTTKTTVKKLKAKKKYFVRIRTYKTVNGKKVYSSWSKAKTVKTK